MKQCNRHREGRNGGIRWVLSILILGIPGAALAQVGGDVIILRDGNRHPGVEILKEDCEQVAFKLGGARQTVPAMEVVDISYGDKPTRYSRAKSYLLTGRYADALKDLDYLIQSASESESAPEWLRPYSLRLKGETLLALAQGDASRYGQAAETLEKFLAEKAYRKHRLEPYVLRLLGDALLGAGEEENAKAAFERLAAVDCPGPWEIYGKLGQARILMKSGEQIDVRSLLADVIKKAGARQDGQGLAGEASLAMGRSWLLENSFKNGMDQFNELIRVGSERFSQSGELQPILAGAYNGLGDAYRLRAEKFGDSKDYTEAVIAYLHVVLFFQTPEGERRHALLHGGKCCEKVGWKEKKKSLHGELKANYPTSKEAGQVGN